MGLGTRNTQNVARGGSYEQTLLASGARTTAQTATFENPGAPVIQVVVDVTAGTSGFSVTPAVNGVDALSGKSYQLHASFTAIAATGTYVYELGPGVGAATGGITAIGNHGLPDNMSFTMAVADAKSVTYSVSVQFID